MPINEELTDRVRRALARADAAVSEKRMFGGSTFLVNGKMCVNVGRDRIMCRVDPARHADLLTTRLCEAVRMKGRELIGWIRVAEDDILTQKDFDSWIRLALDYNASAPASPRRKIR